ncbi:hypothetical protein HNR34_002105 [Geobacillus subterraneus]
MLVRPIDVSDAENFLELYKKLMNLVLCYLSLANGKQRLNNKANRLKECCLNRIKRSLLLKWKTSLSGFLLS